MAHYAVLDENDVVINVIAGRNEDETVGKISNWESYYGRFFNARVKRTSFNMLGGVHAEGKEPFRKNYAVIGGTYSDELDAFIPPKPYPSWTLDEETCLWEAPIPMPAQEGLLLWIWDESALEWQEHLPPE